MLILARVNGYYSPYSAQSITEEEERCFFGNVFTHAEKEFFRHRLQSKFHKITMEDIETALIFLENKRLQTAHVRYTLKADVIAGLCLGGNLIELLHFIMMLSKQILKMETMKMMITSVWNL